MRRSQPPEDLLSRTLLSRAAAEEARRQAARARGDRAAEQQHEAELQKLWHAWATRPVARS